MAVELLRKPEAVADAVEDMRLRRGGKVQELQSDEVQAEQAGAAFLRWWYQGGEELWTYRVRCRGNVAKFIDVRATFLDLLEKSPIRSPLPPILGTPMQPDIDGLLTGMVGRALAEWWTDPRCHHDVLVPSPGGAFVEQDIRTILVRAITESEERLAPWRSP